ncbi:MAG: hypothetical protein WC264_01875 [Candidatus Paceibacterota bacterium]|jgi:hypothetical protein
MDLSQSLNLNTATQNKLFDPTFLNLEYLFNQILNFFRNLFNAEFVGILKFILFFLALFFLIIIIYCAIRIFEIRKKEKEFLHQQIALYAQKQAEKEKALMNKGEGQKNKRWEGVLDHLFSENSADWKVAIIEADSMLEALLDQLGYKGENLGEKLKMIDRDRFRSVDDAWEAHIVRNRIAHEGLQFELTSREAKRVVALYEQVFREFGFI